MDADLRHTRMLGTRSLRATMDAGKSTGKSTGENTGLDAGMNADIDVEIDTGDRAVELTQALVRCPSVTPADEGALETLAGPLRAAGFDVEIVTFEAEGEEGDTPPIQNLFAKIGTGPRMIAFAGHTDVVPIGQESDWSRPAFGAEIHDGRLYGRGTADMKGGVACFAAAAIDYIKAQGVPEDGGIAFLITGDEEGPAINGTDKLMQWVQAKGENFAGCVLGEPTNPEAMGDAIKIGRRGSVSGIITATGVQGHAAYPHFARNPVTALARAVSAIAADTLDEGTEHFQPSNLEFVTIDTGNAAFNVTPASARAHYNIRFNNLHSAESLEARIRTHCETIEADTEVRFSVERVARVSDVFVTEPGELVTILSNAVEQETGRVPALTTNGGTSDARFIKDYCPVVEFGLVGQTMHQVDEHVAVEDIRTLTRIYRGFLDRWFAA
jgi:succinyl-diaminopimelate desuccinylase